MKKIKYLLITLTLASIIILTSCTSKVSKVNKTITKSLQSVAQIQTITTITDQNVLVYEKNILVEIATDNSAKVTTITKEYDLTFELKEKEESSDIESVNRKSLFTMNLDKKLSKQTSYKNGVLVLNVEKDNVAKVLNATNLKVESDATIEFTIKNKLIESINVTFKTTSSKEVRINVTYRY